MNRARPWHIPPLVARELLVYSRQPWTYWLRLLTALGAVSVLAIMATTGQHRLGQADGLSLFAGSTAILFFIASLNGLRSTSDCIASERRQGTLVLLFLADLKLNTILISKLVTNSMRNAWAFLGTLPVLGLCVLLGGVSGLVFVQGVLAVLAAAWLSLMVGLEQSCRNQGEHEAFSKGLRRLLMLNLLPLVSPASLVLSAFLGSFFLGKAYFWATLGGTILVGFVHWSQAKSALAQNWQQPPPEEGPVSSSLRALLEPPPLAGHLQKPPRLCGDTPPAYWLFARYGDTRQVAPLPIGLCFVATAGFVVLVSDLDVIKLSYPLLMGAGRLVQMLAMAKIAPQSFADIARPGALEILQTTPITLKQIVRAAYDFLFVHFRRGVLPMLGLDALALLMVVLRTTEGSAWGFAYVLLAQNSLFLSGLCAMGVTGIWLGLKQRSLTRASFNACFYFLLLPASFYALRIANPVRITVLLVLAYCAIAIVMHLKLGRLVQGGDTVQRLYRRPEW